jgi:hypothetical protein
MACARPVLLLGPRESHAGEIIEAYNVGWRVDHGDVGQLVSLVRTLALNGRGELREMGRRARSAIKGGLSKDWLCRSFCDVVERAMRAKRMNSFKSKTELAPQTTRSSSSRVLAA